MPLELWRIACASALLVALQPAPASAQPDISLVSRFRLETTWEIALPENASILLRFATCPDGSVYALSSQTLDEISPDGKIVASDSTIESGWSIACDGRRRLFVAGSQLSIFEPLPQGTFRQISTAPLKVLVARLLVAPDGSIYGITAEPKPSLITISDSGEEVLLRKGQLPDFEASVTPGLPYPEERSCALAWDTVGDRLAYTLPGQSTEFWHEGKEVSSKKPLSAPKHPLSDRCLPPLQPSLVSLPNGQFARTRTERSEIADALDQGYLDVLDRSLKLIARPVPIDAVLFGSSDDGSLYFVSFHAKVATIAKRTLIPDDSATSN